MAEPDAPSLSSGDSAAAGALAEPPIDLRRHLGALRRNRGLIAFVVATVTIAVLILSLSLPESYRATARVAVVTSEGPLASGDAESIRRRLATMAELLTTSSVLTRAAARLPGESKDSLEDKVGSSVDADADIINVVATASEPARAASIANAVTEAFLRQQAASERQRFARAQARLLRELDRLRGSPRASEQEMDAIRERLSELTASEASAGSELQIAQRAEPPARPYSPHPTRNTVLAFIASLFVATLLALARDHWRPRLNADELASVTGLPLVDVVPSRPHLPTRFGMPTAAYDVRYQELMESVARALDERRSRVALLTSLRDDDGSTEATVELVRALASAGHRTLVASADFRNSRMHRLIGVPRSPGLADVLRSFAQYGEAGAESLAALIRRAPDNWAWADDLDVLASGTPTGHATELVAASPVAAFVKHAQRLRYRYIVVHGPPLLTSRAGWRLARSVGHALLVVRAEQTTVDEAQKLRELLEQRELEILGLVVTGSPREVRRYRDLAHPAYAREPFDREPPQSPVAVPPEADVRAPVERGLEARPARTPGDGTTAGPGAESDARAERILEALVSFKRPVSDGELRATLGYASRTTLSRYLKRLLEEGKIVRSGSGTRHSPYMYEPAAPREGNARPTARRKR